MNILCSYKKNRDEKIFFVAGVKKTNLRRSKMTLYLTFFVFSIPVAQKVFSIRFFFARIDIFYMNIQKFCLEFFEILKYIKNAFCTTGSSAPVSQNIMSTNYRLFRQSILEKSNFSNSQPR